MKELGISTLFLPGALTRGTQQIHHHHSSRYNQTKPRLGYGPDRKSVLVPLRPYVQLINRVLHYHNHPLCVRFAVHSEWHWPLLSKAKHLWPIQSKFLQSEFGLNQVTLKGNYDIFVCLFLMESCWYNGKWCISFGFMDIQIYLLILLPMYCLHALNMNCYGLQKRYYLFLPTPQKCSSIY